MKKILLLLLLFLFALPSFSAIILINGHKAEFTKLDIKDNDIAFVPLRDLETFGLGVISQADNGSVEFSTNKMNLLFAKNSDSVKMNSLSLKLPMSTYIDEGKFMVPLAFIIKSLNGEYNQANELIITIDNIQIKSEKKAPVINTAVPNTPLVEQKSEEPNEEITKKVKEEAAKTETLTEEYKAPSIEDNWFQGTVMAYSKRLNRIDIDLYDSSKKLIATTQSHDGTFAFKNIKDGKYFILIDHKKNPSFRTFKTSVFEVKDFAGKKISKPLNIIRAIKSDGIKEIKINDQTCYSITWSEVPTVANYKVVLTSSNSKAKMPKYDKKTEKINIPISDLSKGQTYGINITAYDKNGNIIGESSDKGWTFTTP